ncbi:MAG: GNAT family N-acetyltransferase [Iamia sp.]
MIRDPLEEVLEVAERTPDEATAADLDPGDVATLALARRRFGVALPPPFAPRPAEPARLPIRSGGPTDGAAIAAVQRRAWRASYRGVVSDAFLDDLDLDYLGGLWGGRAAVAPSARHRLLVAGRPGEVHGVVDTGPTRDEDGRGQAELGEIRNLHVDPSVAGAGLGSTLLAAAEAALAASGFTGATLWVIEGNARARRFYGRWGWAADGATKTTKAGTEDLSVVRYRLTRALGAA